MNWWHSKKFKIQSAKGFSRSKVTVNTTITHNNNKNSTRIPTKRPNGSPIENKTRVEWRFWPWAWDRGRGRVSSRGSKGRRGCWRSGRGGGWRSPTWSGRGGRWWRDGSRRLRRRRPCRGTGADRVTSGWGGRWRRHAIGERRRRKPKLEAALLGGGEASKMKKIEKRWVCGKKSGDPPWGRGRRRGWWWVHVMGMWWERMVLVYIIIWFGCERKV